MVGSKQSFAHTKKKHDELIFVFSPVGIETRDLSAPLSWLVQALHSCYRRLMQMDDSKELKRARSCSLRQSVAAPEIIKQKKWLNDPSNECCAETGHRDHQATVPTRRRGRNAEHIPCWRGKGSLWYESESKSKSFHTLENKGCVPTQVTWLFQNFCFWQ